MSGRKELTYPRADPYLEMRGETGRRNLRSDYPKAIPWDTQWFAEWREIVGL